ncbi:GNAT family N-acetyltransferase [Microbacterium sp. LBN7]|uniref:GNAT family N-acetyltransferase n=1 Tax=Microbacterium sp. LBN7 TaxID=3129773 RepID=UPI0032430EBA
MTEFLRPRPIAAGDRVSDFRCGEEQLDAWLRARARGNERSGASRTMVSVLRDGRVAGYYCLSSSAIVRDAVPAELSRQQPDPVPVVLLGRLAVDEAFAGQGLGASLLQHATVRAVEAAEAIGIRAILVHAMTEGVVPFYERYGFTRFPGEERTLYMLLADVRETLL